MIIKNPIFHRERFLQIRDETMDVCLDNEPTAKFISVLLFHHSGRVIASEHAANQNERKVRKGKKADQDESASMYLTQDQIIRDSASMLTKKTLIAVAIPFAKLLGFVSVDASDKVHCYTLDIDRFQRALDANDEGLFSRWLAENVQLEHIKDNDVKTFLEENKKIATQLYLCCKEHGTLKRKKIACPSRKMSTSPTTRRPTKSQEYSCAVPPPASSEPDKKNVELSSRAQKLFLLWQERLGEDDTMYQRWEKNAQALEKISKTIETVEKLDSLLAFIGEKDKKRQYFKNVKLQPYLAAQSFYFDEWLKLEQQRNILNVDENRDIHDKRLRETREKLRAVEQESQQLAQARASGQIKVRSKTDVMNLLQEARQKKRETEAIAG